MNKKHLITIAALMLSVGIAVLALGRVPTPKEKDCLIAKGIVSKITEGGVKDVVFELEGHTKLYYINRGLEQGLNLATLRTELTGIEVTIKYPDYFSLLDPGKSIRHISKIEKDGKTIFSELD